MTSLDQPGQPSKDDHKRGEDGNRPAVRSSRSGRQNRHLGRRYKSRRFWIGLSAIALLGLAGVFIYVGVGGTHHAASSGSSGTAQGRNSAGGAPPKGTSTAEGKVISAAKLAENGGHLPFPRACRPVPSSGNPVPEAGTWPPCRVGLARRCRRRASGSTPR